MGSAAATQEDLAEDTPLLLRAAETSAGGTRFPPQLAGSVVGFEVGFTGDAGFTAAADITAQDSVSACIRPMGMQRRSAIPLDFMTSTVWRYYPGCASPTGTNT